MTFELDPQVLAYMDALPAELAFVDYFELARPSADNKSMPRGHTIDLDQLQQLLYERADRLGRLRIEQRKLAAELGVTFEALCRAFGRMTEQGRIKRIGSGHRNVGRYLIYDPEEG